MTSERYFMLCKYFIVTLGLLSFLSAGSLVQAEEKTLDRFDYRSDDAAQQAWRSSEGTGPVTSREIGDRRGVHLDLPFRSSPTKRRFVIDRSARLDLSSFGRFELTLDCDQPEAVSFVSFYFHTPGGWYSAGGKIPDAGRATLVFDKEDFNKEESPSGWDRIDGIRIAAWRGKPTDANLTLLDLVAVRNPIAILEPSGDDGEAINGRRTAAQVQQMLADSGVDTDRLSVDRLSAAQLTGRSVVLAPYCHPIPPAAQDELVRYIQGGGKLILCYWLPERLGRALGFGQPVHRALEREGLFSSMEFRSGVIPGMPRKVGQKSWNITAAQPATDDAQVLAWWYDAAGQPIDEPAVLLSPRGAFFSHVILPDDWEKKREMLVALLGHFDPSLWQALVDRALDRLWHVGPFMTKQQVIDHYRLYVPPIAATDHNRAGRIDIAAVRSLLDQADRATIEANRAIENYGPEYGPIVIRKLGDIHGQLCRAYAIAQESPTVEARAFWEHSGLGSYPGDWERTADALARANINMIFPNMLWAGRAHYPSKYLPESRTYKEYGDQIEQCLAACKPRGIEVHVWKVNFNLTGAPQELVDRYRATGRLQVSATGSVEPWLCPSNPENRTLEAASMVEVATKYKVDGIHFDYIRYPGSSYCFCDGCRARFEEELARPVASWPADCIRGGVLYNRYNQFRRKQISELVERVSVDARSVRPDIEISAAVFPNHRDSLSSIAQDWPYWAQHGWIDFVCPMNYTESDRQFGDWVADQRRLAAARIPLISGIGATSANSRLTPDRVIGQINIAREKGANGFIIFALNRDTPEKLLPALKLGVTAEKAAVPGMGKVDSGQ